MMQYSIAEAEMRNPHDGESRNTANYKLLRGDYVLRHHHNRPSWGLTRSTYHLGNINSLKSRGTMGILEICNYCTPYSVHYSHKYNEKPISLGRCCAIRRRKEQLINPA